MKSHISEQQENIFFSEHMKEKRLTHSQRFPNVPLGFFSLSLQVNSSACVLPSMPGAAPSACLQRWIPYQVGHFSRV